MGVVIDDLIVFVVFNFSFGLNTTKTRIDVMATASPMSTNNTPAMIEPMQIIRLFGDFLGIGFSFFILLENNFERKCKSYKVDVHKFLKN